MAGNRRRIVSTFSKVFWPDGSEDYEEEHGFLDKRGVSMELDTIDKEEGLTVVEKAAEFLRDQGALEPSSSSFHTGVWYSTESSQDYRSGEYETNSFHLKDFSPDEERLIYALVTKRR